MLLLLLFIIIIVVVVIITIILVLVAKMNADEGIREDSFKICPLIGLSKGKLIL